MNRFLQVDGHNNLVRDSNTGAILNTDDLALSKAQQIAMKARQEKRRLECLEERVERQEQTLLEIKSLLIKALEK